MAWYGASHSIPCICSWQEQCQLQQVRIQQLEENILEMVQTLKPQPTADGQSSLVEFSSLQQELVAAKKELWKERLRSDAIKSANKRADEAMGIALANEKMKCSQLEEEYVAATIKITRLEDLNRCVAHSEWHLEEHPGS